MMGVIYRFFIIVLCVIVAPIVMGIAFVISVFSGMPVFFRQKRVGKDGKIFTMYKFRTMRNGAESQQKKLQHSNETDGPAFKIRNDPRFTPIGRWLSHTGLDELPQLFNVLTGDMAIIGPRPLPISEEKKLQVWQRARESIMPGIFSPWILDGYHRTTFDAWMRSDIAYIKEKSFWYDLRLFLRMIAFMGSLIGHELVDG